MQLFEQVVDEHQKVVAAARDLLGPAMESAVRVCGAGLAAGRTILICGNGGSAADAQHFAAELIGRYETERVSLSAIALSTDTSILTALANDYGYEQVFARQVEGLGRTGDVLIAISTSGNSPNVLAAANSAKVRGISVIALTGQGGGKLAALADIVIAVPSTRVARIQEVHELCLHTLAQALEASA